MDKRILIVSMFSIAIITVPIWVGWICWISDLRGNNSARLTYKQFKAIYDVTPECFEMYSTWVEYEHNNVEFIVGTVRNKHEYKSNSGRFQMD